MLGTFGDNPKSIHEEKTYLRRSLQAHDPPRPTDSFHDYSVAKNLFNREFTADKPDQKWVSDITYIPTGEGWLYLITVLDLADRKVIGWALSDNLKAVDTRVAAFGHLRVYRGLAAAAAV